MMYTVNSASYADSDHRTAIVDTAEVGFVAASETDTPELWAAVMAWGEPVDFALPTPTIDDYRRAIQSHVDSTAQQRAYDSGVTCSSYVNSTNPAWAAQAANFIAWRDAVWAYAFTELVKVEGGTRPQPSVAEIIAELPPMVWPAFE